MMNHFQRCERMIVKALAFCLSDQQLACFAFAYTKPVDKVAELRNDPLANEYTPWSDKDHQAIRDHLKEGDGAIAAILRRSVNAVAKERSRMDLLRKVPIRVPELMHAVKNPNLTRADIAEDLGCSLERANSLKRLANRFAA